MCPLMAYMGNDPQRLRCWMGMLDQGVSIPFAPAAVDGWGVGYFTGDRVLSSKRPHIARPWRFGAELADIESKMALWHIAPRDGLTLDEQPLHYGQWLFACEGELHVLPDGREDLTMQLPEHFVRRIKTHSPHELLFYWLLAKLQRESRLDAPPGLLGPLVELVQQSVNDFAEEYLEGHQLEQLAAVLSNGRQLLVLSRHGELHISFKEGLPSCPACGEEASVDYSLKEAHSRARAVVLIRGIEALEGAGWQKVGEHNIIAIDKDLSIHHYRWSPR